MNLTSAAIEAAEQAVIQAMIKDGPDGHIDGYQEITRAALEAAAPHIAARALEEAAAAIDGGGSISSWLKERAETIRTNPYRSQS